MLVLLVFPLHLVLQLLSLLQVVVDLPLELLDFFLEFLVIRQLLISLCSLLVSELLQIFILFSELLSEPGELSL